MKKTIIYIICGILLASCSGFLDQQPRTSLTQDTAFNSESTIEAQVYGCYLSMHSSALWKGTMAEFFHTASGLLVWKGKRSTDEWLDGLNLGKYSTNKDGNTTMWAALFTGINRCNRFVENIQDSPVDEEFKIQEEAEVRLIRAILYYTAVRVWGDVPLTLHAAKNYREVSVPRTHFAEVYRQVLEDLTFAEEHMRDAAEQEAVAPGMGRPNKWAATAMKASVYLTIGSLLESPDDNFWDTTKPGRIPDFSDSGISSAEDAFQLAYDIAENVIENGPYSLVPDYRTLFRWTEAGDWFLPERIFCLPSTNEAGTNYNSVRMLPNYPEGSSNTNTVNNNWGRVRPSRFLIDNFIRVGGGSKGEGDEWTEDIYTTTTDPRYQASFFTVFRSIQAGSEKDVKTYPASSAVNNTNDTYSMAFIKKYLDPTYDVTNGKADFYLMRLAELYLISAESAAYLSTSVGDEKFLKAVDRVNDIRSRARQSTDGAEATMPVAVTAANVATRDSLLSIIFWERVCELCGEGHEWFDTHRHGATWLRDNISIPENKFLEGNDKMETHWLYTYTGANLREHTFPEDVDQLRKSLLNAVPYAEMTYNTKIFEQNDFYWQ